MSEEISPRHRVANELRKAINEGVYSPGEQIPSQRVLGKMYDVVQNTAAEGVKILQLEGLLTNPVKARPRVRAKRALLRLGAERYSNRLRAETGLSPFRAEVEKQGKTPRVDCTSIESVQAPQEVVDRLNLTDADEMVVRRENWYFADDEPVQFGITYIPWRIAEGTPLADSTNLGKGSLYGRFEDKGHRISSIREEVSARPPTPEEVESLKIPVGTSVIEVLHTGYDQDKQPFEVTRFVMRGDLNGLDYRIKIED